MLPLLLSVPISVMATSSSAATAVVQNDKNANTTDGGVYGRKMLRHHHHHESVSSSSSNLNNNHDGRQQQQRFRRHKNAGDDGGGGEYGAGGGIDVGLGPSAIVVNDPYHVRRGLEDMVDGGDEVDENNGNNNNNNNDGDADNIENEGDGNDEGQQQQQQDGVAEEDVTTTSYVQATQCVSFVTEQGYDDLDTIMEYSTVRWFYVPQQSYMYYTSHTNNNNVDGSTTTSYIIDLTSWANGVTNAMGMNTQQASCTVLSNAEDVFGTDRNDDVNTYFGIDIDEYMSLNGLDNVDWTPSRLYVGPICSMKNNNIIRRKTSPSFDVGIFLDNTCTTYVPTLTYEYRKLLKKGKTTNGVATAVSTANKMSAGMLTCSDDDSSGAFCDEILQASANVATCVNNESQNENDNNNNNGRSRRRMQQEEDGDAGDDNEDQESSSSSSSSSVEYQISQEDLHDIESACSSAQYAIDRGMTLEAHMKRHKQSLNGNDGRLSTAGRFAIVVILLWMAAVVVAAIVPRLKMYLKRKNDRQTSSMRTNGTDDTSDSSIDSKEIPLVVHTRTYKRRRFFLFPFNLFRRRRQQQRRRRWQQRRRRQQRQRRRT